MVLAEFSMTPIGKGESVGRYVARVLRIVDRSGLPYRLGPMGTCVEGTWDQVFGLIRTCHRALQRDCPRVSILIKVDVRRGRKGALESKIASVQRHAGRTFRTT